MNRRKLSLAMSLTLAIFALTSMYEPAAWGADIRNRAVPIDPANGGTCNEKSGNNWPFVMPFDG